MSCDGNGTPMSFLLVFFPPAWPFVFMQALTCDPLKVMTIIVTLFTFIAVMVGIIFGSIFGCFSLFQKIDKKYNLGYFEDPAKQD